MSEFAYNTNITRIYAHPDYIFPQEIEYEVEIIVRFDFDNFEIIEVKIIDFDRSAIDHPAWRSIPQIGDKINLSKKEIKEICKKILEENYDNAM